MLLFVIITALSKRSYEEYKIEPDRSKVGKVKNILFTDPTSLGQRNDYKELKEVFPIAMDELLRSGTRVVSTINRIRNQKILFDLYGQLSSDLLCSTIDSTLVIKTVLNYCENMYLSLLSTLIKKSSKCLNNIPYYDMAASIEVYKGPKYSFYQLITAHYKWDKYYGLRYKFMFLNYISKSQRINSIHQLSSNDLCEKYENKFQGLYAISLALDYAQNYSEKELIELFTVAKDCLQHLTISIRVIDKDTITRALSKVH